jgi:hypothetical protein
MPRKSKRPSRGDRSAAERPFVDREELIAAFRTALHETGRTEPKVLVYHGGAGIGKSRLRRELVRIVDSSQQTVDRAVVTATLDFAIPSYRQTESALLFLRNTLHEAYKTSFPSFDLAYAVLWQKGHPEVPLGDDVKPLLEPGSLLPQLLDASGKLPLIGLIPKVSALVGSRQHVVDGVGPTSNLLPTTYYATWWRQRGERELEDLPQMEPAAVVECLPKLWAADLKEFIVQRSSFIVGRKAVLFIDSYEQLWETGSSGQGTADSRQETGDSRQKTDEWVRELVKQLPEVLWVISGRQKLRWEEAEKEWGDVLSQHELGPLPEHSARQFLSSWASRMSRFRMRSSKAARACRTTWTWPWIRSWRSNAPGNASRSRSSRQAQRKVRSPNAERRVSERKPQRSCSRSSSGT